MELIKTGRNLLTKNQQLGGKVYQLLASRYFFVGVMVVFVIQALWLAASAIYPLPFDEYYHVGIIQLYAEQWSPWIDAQPAAANLYGDVTRLSSYLYHYLMSFPYRLVRLAVNQPAAQIVALRFINVALMATSLVLFHRLLRRGGLSRAIVNVTMAIVAFTPIVPLLAAHVNYDNAMLALAPLFLSGIYTIATAPAVKSGLLAGTLSLGFVTSLIKSAFLPVLAAGTLYVLAVLWRRHRSSLLPRAVQAWRVLRRGLQVGLVVSVLVSSGLFVERYGINLIQYGTIRPQCHQIQPVTVCLGHSPWRRNYHNRLNPPAEAWFETPVAGGYTVHWFSKIMRGYFAVFSHTPTQVVSAYEPFGPIALKPLLPLPISLAYLGVAAGSVALIRQRRRLWQQSFMRLAIIIGLSLVGVLWLLNFRGYLNLGVPQGIQARYTLLVLPLILALMVQAVSYSLYSRQLKAYLALLGVGLYCYSGGIAGFIIRADSQWYWQDPRIIRLNQFIQSIAKRLIIH